MEAGTELGRLSLEVRHVGDRDDVAIIAGDGDSREFSHLFLQLHQFDNFLIELEATVANFVFDVEVDVIDVLVVGSFQPGVVLPYFQQILIALQDHDEGELMSHEVLGDGLIAVFAFLALGIGLQFLFFRPLFFNG